MTWKNRIVGYDTKPASQFTAHLKIEKVDQARAA